MNPVFNLYSQQKSLKIPAFIQTQSLILHTVAIIQLDPLHPYARVYCHHPPPSTNPGLVPRLAVENSKNSEEEIDNVKVQGDSRCNLLFHVVMSHDELRVDQNVTTEDQRSDSSIYQFRRAVVWEESCHEPEQDQSPKPSEQIRHPRGEVVLGLTSKKSQGNKDTGRENQSFQHDFRVVE